MNAFMLKPLNMFIHISVHSSSLSLPTKIMSLEEQPQHDESEEVHKECCSRSHEPPSSPIHAALGQVIKCER